MRTGLLSLVLLLSLFSFSIQGCALKAPGTGDMATRGPALTGGDSDAIDGLRKTLDGKRNEGDRQGELSALLDMGKALVSSGRYVEAEKTARQAARLGKKLKDETGLSFAYDLQAEAWLFSGRPEKALKVLDKAGKESGAGQESGTRLNLRGLALMEMGKHAEASRVLMSALDANRRSGDKAGLAESYRALGLAAMAAKSPDALTFFMEAYRLDRESGDMENVGYGLGKMAEIALEKGRREEAVFLFERSYAAYKETGSEKGALNGLESLIEVLRALGQDEKALYYTGVKEDILKKMEGGRRDR